MDQLTGALVAERAEAVRARIEAAGGDPERVRIVAVTKALGPEAPQAAVEAGLTHLGENYAQELVAKAPEVAGEPCWHFIGRLQRNKVRALAGLVSLWESVDRLSLGQEIAKRAPGAAVLAQVNISAEEHKGGCPPGEVAELVAALVDLGLDVRGLMGVAAAGSPDVARPQFAELARLADDLGLPERSMGMSGDLEAAVAEGSTMVRVGTALFGPRPPVSDPDVRHL